MSLFINFFTFKKTIAVVLSSLVMLCNLPAENLISEYRMKLKQLELNQDDVNSFDRLIMNPYSKTLDYAGTGFTALMLFTPSVMFAAPKEDYWKIGLEYAETIALAYGVKELIKMNVSRARPYMYFNGAPVDKFEDDDWDDSFISGHTTLSFAAASFTTFMYCQYFPDSRFKSSSVTFVHSIRFEIIFSMSTIGEIKYACSIFLQMSAFIEKNAPMLFAIKITVSYEVFRLFTAASISLFVSHGEFVL